MHLINLRSNLSSVVQFLNWSGDIFHSTFTLFNIGSGLDTHIVFSFHVFLVSLNLYYFSSFSLSFMTLGFLKNIIPFLFLDKSFFLLWVCLMFSHDKSQVMYSQLDYNISHLEIHNTFHLSLVILILITQRVALFLFVIFFLLKLMQNLWGNDLRWCQYSTPHQNLVVINVYKILIF